MSNNNCPECTTELEWDGAYLCVPCGEHYKKIGYCPECDKELEKLQACGSASYFCNSCNELKSKSRVKIVFEVINPV
ncbi:zinc ribbon domain-containing protein [Vibrio sp. YMD68]|uniref:zinc ribbon domain-containing protein n=1 Tax=Vibrio sp. YMD68 TaxID=3042300 RepID=UPI00249BECB8|nr:zinc ribbon domain-containing protein [Vibrio sp. YMD68]WGW01014.1 zinc ribbon domain-containing protein [Vibrio sp. YMD68]